MAAIVVKKLSFTGKHSPALCAHGTFYLLTL